MNEFIYVLRFSVVLMILTPLLLIEYPVVKFVRFKSCRLLCAYMLLYIVCVVGFK